MIRNALFLFGACVALFVFFLPSYLQMMDLHEKNVSYERQNRDISRENEALLEEKRRLEEDPAYFERYAREKFGIIKDGETIYKFIPPALLNTTVTNSQLPVGVKTPEQAATKAGKSVAAKTSVKSGKSGKSQLSSGTVKKTVTKKTGLGTKDLLDPLSDIGSE